MQQKRFFKRAEQMRDLSPSRLEQVHLALELCLHLLEGHSLATQLAEATELGQRDKVINRLARLRRQHGIHQANFGPAANHTFAETKQLFDLLNGVGRLDPLIICFRRCRRGKPENLAIAILLGHLMKLGL